MEEICTACGRTNVSFIKTLFFYICEDEQECIAEFSGWNRPIED